DVRRVPRAAGAADGTHGLADAVALAGDAAPAVRARGRHVRRPRAAGAALGADGRARAALRPRPPRSAVQLLRQRVAATRRGDASHGPPAVDRGPGARTARHLPR